MKTKDDDFPSLSVREMMILRMLIGAGEMYGLEMVTQSDGVLKRGSIYVMLSRLEDDKGLVESRLEELGPDAGPPRRLYTITGHGIRVMRFWEQAVTQMMTGKALA